MLHFRYLLLDRLNPSHHTRIELRLLRYNRLLWRSVAWLIILRRGWLLSLDDRLSFLRGDVLLACSFANCLCLTADAVTVLSQLSEGRRRSLLVTVEVFGQFLIPDCEVFNVCPCTEGLCALDPRHDIEIV